MFFFFFHITFNRLQLKRVVRTVVKINKHHGQYQVHDKTIVTTRISKIVCFRSKRDEKSSRRMRNKKVTV